MAGMKNRTRPLFVVDVHSDEKGMKMRLSISIFFLFIPAIGHADAIRCKLPSGKVVITDTACPSSSSIEKIQPAEVLSESRKRQAYEVNRRMVEQIYDIEAEKRAENLRRSQADSESKARESQRRTQKTVADDYQGLPTQASGKNTAAGETYYRPSGSQFSYGKNGETYYRPDGSQFSHGKNGKTCFHYGQFADCK